MPRNVKESDDEFETKGGRRTRTTLNPSILDSPLRRSTRIKQPVGQDGSSPESNSDVSIVGGTRNARRRTTAADGANAEQTRNLRTRRNSAVSDISEITEIESLVDSAAKRITRRSVGTAPSFGTPTTLRGRTRRTTRAGSESKSTPPAGRVTRRTRASSMEPESTDPPKVQEVGTPMNSRKRASAVPSEPAVVEESENVSGVDGLRKMEKTVYEMDETAASDNMSEPLRRKSKGEPPCDETMKVSETFENTETAPDISQLPKNHGDSTKILDSPTKEKDFGDISPRRQSVSSPSKGSSYTIENLLNRSTEWEEKSPGNKENEVSNTSDGLLERNFISANSDARSLCKSLNSAFSKETLYDIPIEEEHSSDHYEPEALKIEKLVGKEVSETRTKKDYSVDVDCTVVIEPMQVDKVDKTTVKCNDTWRSPYNPEIGKVHREEKAQVENNAEKNEDITKAVDTLRMSNVVGSVSGENKERDDPTKVINVDSKREKASWRRSEGMTHEDSRTKRLSAEMMIIRRASTGSDERRKSKENEEIIIYEIVKDSSATGTSVMEAPEVSEENKRTYDKQSSKKIESVGDKSKNCENECELVVFESDSESISCPSFKDIPADEWTADGANNEESKGNDVDTNFVNLSSNESNKSNDDLTSVVKNVLQTVDNNGEERERGSLHFDSDNIMAGSAAALISDDEAVANEETPMDVSSDTEREKYEDRANSRKKSLKKRASNSIKLRSAMDSKIVETSDSLIGFNISGRKFSSDDPSFMDEESNDNTLSNVSLNKSTKSRKDRSLSAIDRRQNEDENDDNGAKKTPRRRSAAFRKSLVGSVKKSNDFTLDTSKEKFLDTPSKVNNDTLDKSVNKSSRADPKTDENGSDAEEMDESDVLKLSLRPEDDGPIPVENSARTNSANETSDDNSSENRASLGTREAKINKSAKPETVRISLNNKDNLSQSSSDDEIEQNESHRENSSETSEKSEKSGRKSLTAKSKTEETSSKFEITEDTRGKFNVSAKFESKSLNRGNKSKIDDLNSEENDDIPRKLNGSGKSRSGRKSLNKSKIELSDESPSKLAQSVKSGSDRKSLNENNESTSDIEEKDNFPRSGKSLNSSKRSDEADESPLGQSDKSGSGRKSLYGKNKSKKAHSILEIEDKLHEELDESTSARKSIINENYSTVAMFNSDSEVDSDFDEKCKIPGFLFGFGKIRVNGDSSSENDDSARSIDSDVARELNLDGKSVLEYSDDDVSGDDCMATETESSDSNEEDLIDFIVDDDDKENSDIANASDSEDNMKNESNSEDYEKPKTRKRIITKSADVESDETMESDDETQVEKSPNKNFNRSSKTVKTAVETIVFHESARELPKRNKNIQSSTPKILTRERVESEKLNYSKSIKSSKVEVTPTKLETGQIGSTKKASMVTDTNDKPERVGSSLKKTKVRKTPGIDQVETSGNINDSPYRTNLSKSTKVLALHQTMSTPNSESPEARFLMKEKLNDTLPALKLQQMRRSALDNLRAEGRLEVATTIDEKTTAERHSIREDVTWSKPENKKMTLETSADEDEFYAKLQESNEFWEEKTSDEYESVKESTKRKKKKKKVEEMENEESIKTEDLPKKKNKKKKLMEEPIEDVETEVIRKKKKKQKIKQEKEHVEDVETKEIKKKKKKEKIVQAVETAPVPVMRKKLPKRRPDDSSGFTVDRKSKEPTNLTKRKLPQLARAHLEQRVSKDSSTVFTVIRTPKEPTNLSKSAKSVQPANNLYKPNTAETTRSAKGRKIEKPRTSIKRLPDDILESLPDIAERPKKRPRIATEEKPSRRISQTPANITCGDFVSLSTSGSTTQFGVVDIRRAAKKSNKSVAVKTFRERMLARNPRQPVSAYLVYQQKQKASGKDGAY